MTADRAGYSLPSWLTWLTGAQAQQILRTLLLASSCRTATRVQLLAARILPDSTSLSPTGGETRRYNPWVAEGQGWTFEHPTMVFNGVQKPCFLFSDSMITPAAGSIWVSNMQGEFRVLPPRCSYQRSNCYSP